MKFRHLLYLMASATLIVSCQKKSEPDITPTDQHDVTTAPPAWKAFPSLTYQTIRELPHDPLAFTQGFLLHDGVWIESTGLQDQSSIRRVEVETGKVLLMKELKGDFFGEGATVLDGKIYQLSWKNQQGFVFDATTLAWKKNFSYNGEGWGVTTDGRQLIMSDGTETIRFYDPAAFAFTRAIEVKKAGQPLKMLNELEYVEGEIFANVWQTNEIVRINPANGEVLGVIDLTGIDKAEEKKSVDHVLNGIAYDHDKKLLYVTGKCWPKIYQINLIEKN
jgi:glutaminyl-peptide cyclotransferase